MGDFGRQECQVCVSVAAGNQRGMAACHLPALKPSLNLTV